MNNNQADGRNASKGSNTGSSGEDMQNQSQQSGSSGSGNPAGQTTQGGDGVQKSSVAKATNKTA